MSNVTFQETVSSKQPRASFHLFWVEYVLQQPRLPGLLKLPLLAVLSPAALTEWQKVACVSDYYGISWDLHQENSNGEQQETVVREVILGFVTVECSIVFPETQHDGREYFWWYAVTPPLVFDSVIERTFHVTPQSTNVTETENVQCYKKLFSLRFLRKSEWHHWAVTETRTSLTKWDNPRPAEVQWAQTVLFWVQSFLPL